MNEFQFETVKRSAVHLRLLLVGESGNGKTYTSLALAHHMAELAGWSPEQIAVIDTEVHEKDGDLVGRVELYDSEPCRCSSCQGHGLKFERFKLLKMGGSNRSPRQMLGAIKAAARVGAKVLIIDGLFHEWEWCNNEVDRLKPAFKGNKWAAWSDVTPQHDQFIQAILDFPGHVIACCRGKEKTQQVEGRIESLGLKPQQRPGVEYEMQFWLNLFRGNAHVMTTRSSRLNPGRVFPGAGAELAGELLTWAESGDSDQSATLDALKQDVFAMAKALPEKERDSVAGFLETASTLNQVKRAKDRVAVLLESSAEKEREGRDASDSRPAPSPSPEETEAQPAAFPVAQ